MSAETWSVPDYVLPDYVLVNSPDAGIYAALKDAHLFQKVSIELGALTWPNGADLGCGRMRNSVKIKRGLSLINDAVHPRGGR